jgi:AcrR family transcriptional regulator
MPKIWAETIDTHRRQVHDAILEATAELIAEHGPMSVAMSAIAERAGIGRATLYKYFPDVESILIAWHERDFGHHLEHLRSLSESDTVTLDDFIRFVRHQQRTHHTDRDVIGTLAHAIAGDHSIPDAVETQVHDALAALLGTLASRGELRADLPAETLARWVFHTIHAPHDIDNNAIVELLTASLTPPPRQRRKAQRSH